MAQNLEFYVTNLWSDTLLKQKTQESLKYIV